MNNRTTEVLDYIPLAGISFNELFTLCYWFVETHELHAALGNMNAKGHAHKKRDGKWYPGVNPSEVEIDGVVNDILSRAQAGIAEPLETQGSDFF